MENQMEKTFKGSVLDVTEGIICHQVNCKGVMGAGLAKAIRERWPAVYTDYMNAFKVDRLRLGVVIWTQVADKLYVASLCGQDGYGRDKDIRYTNYDALRACLLVVASADMPVTIPKGMGCTLANGDWDVVSQIIAETIPDAVIAEYGNKPAIDSFAGAHRFLSNFHPSPIQIQLPAGEMLIFPTVEHFYQAMKSEHVQDWIDIANLPTPGQTKRAGKKLLIRSDWEHMKLVFMENALRAKFQIPSLREQLQATGNAELIEGNTWGDTFWGMCKGKGQNHLGRLLMKIRGEIG